jgi:hypothetical protein
MRAVIFMLGALSLANTFRSPEPPFRPAAALSGPFLVHWPASVSV